MARKKNKKRPGKKKLLTKRSRSNPFLGQGPSGVKRSPTYKQISRDLSELDPYLRAGGFEDFVLVGYRRLAEEEREKYGGAKEAPFYFYHFPNLFAAGAIMDWATEDIKKKLVNNMLTQPSGAVQKPPEGEAGSTEKENADT